MDHIFEKFRDTSKENPNYKWEFQVKDYDKHKVLRDNGDAGFKKLTAAGVEFGTSMEGMFVMGDTSAEKANAIKVLKSLGINEEFEIVEISEARKSIKRKYGIHSSTNVNEKAPLRNKIIKYIGNSVMTTEQISNMLIRVSEDLGKAVNQKRWFKSNTKYFKMRKNESGEPTYELSKLGKRIFDSMTGTKTVTNKKLVNESDESKDLVLESFSDFKDGVELLEGKKMLSMKKVKPGMVATDYFGEKSKVIMVGTIGKDWKKMQTYDSSGAMAELVNSPEDFGYEEDELKDLEIMATEDENSQTAVFSYDGDGAVVYK